MLYGLVHSASYLWFAEQFFIARDYEVYRIDHSSIKKDFDQLAEQRRHESHTLCPSDPSFLTHSMGGTILRAIKSIHPDFSILWVVMLGPPNHGSEIVYEWGNWKLFA